MSLNGLMGMVVIGGLLITAIFYGLQRLVVPKIPLREKKGKKVKAKMSVGESFAFLAASPYIRDLALLVSGRGGRRQRWLPWGCVEGSSCVWRGGEDMHRHTC